MILSDNLFFCYHSVMLKWMFMCNMGCWVHGWIIFSLYDLLYPCFLLFYVHHRALLCCRGYLSCLPYLLCHLCHLSYLLCHLFWVLSRAYLLQSLCALFALVLLFPKFPWSGTRP